MTFNFTIANWTMNIDTPNGTQKGFVIPFRQYNIQDPIIQVYQDHEKGELELKANGFDVVVTLLNNDIVISSHKPFNGKLFIK